MEVTDRSDLQQVAPQSGEPGDYEAAWGDADDERGEGAAATAEEPGDGQEAETGHARDGKDEGDGENGSVQGDEPSGAAAQPRETDSVPTAAPDWQAEFARQKAETEALKRQLESLLRTDGGWEGTGCALPRSASELSTCAANESECRPGRPVERHGVVNMAALSPELAEQLKTFASRYPDLAPLAREHSLLGEGIRKRLETYGAEEAADYAAPAWEARRARQEAERQREEEARRSSERYAQEFQTAVFSGAPDFAEAMQAGRGAQYLAEVEQWAQSKPYGEATRLLNVIERGTAPETLRLLEQYRAERKGGRTSAVAAAAAAMAAVPGHQQPMGIKPQPRKSDYDAAWAEKD